jgi:hypothetical protein
MGMDALLAEGLINAATAAGMQSVRIASPWERIQK